MSVVLDRPLVRTRLPEGGVPVVLEPRIRVEPDYRPNIGIPVEIPVEIPAKVRRRHSVWTARAVGLKCLMFAGMFSATYVASTLSGHYLVEKSRNQSNEALTRSTMALNSEREVQRRLDVLTSASSIEDWALSHAFRPTDGLGQTSKVVNLVASNQ